MFVHNIHLILTSRYISYRLVSGSFLTLIWVGLSQRVSEEHSPQKYTVGINSNQVCKGESELLFGGRFSVVRSRRVYHIGEWAVE